MRTIVATVMSSNENDDTAGAPPTAYSPPVRDVPQIVGTNLRQLRKARGHSLERLAELSGVSRAMLGQIETGKSAPTVSLLWRIADALNVPVKTLLATEREPDVLVLSRTGADLLVARDGGLVTRDLMPIGQKSLRFLELQFVSGHRAAFPPSPIGTRQSLVVAGGRLSVEIGSEAPVVLEEGDAVVFEASEACAVENLSPSQAIAYLVALTPTS